MLFLHQLLLGDLLSELFISGVLGLQFLQQLLDLLVVAFRFLNALDLVMLLRVDALHSLDVHA